MLSYRQGPPSSRSTTTSSIQTSHTGSSDAPLQSINMVGVVDRCCPDFAHGRLPPCCSHCVRHDHRTRLQEQQFLVQIVKPNYLVVLFGYCVKQSHAMVTTPHQYSPWVPSHCDSRRFKCKHCYKTVTLEPVTFFLSDAHFVAVLALKANSYLVT